MKLNTLFKLMLATSLIGLTFLVVNSLFQIKKIESDTQKEKTLTLASKAALNARYHTVQIQQFLTDASLMKDVDGVKEGKENLESALKQVDLMIDAFPERKKDLDALKVSLQKLFSVGEEMFHAYLEKGPEAGNEIMKRPKTGLDETSEETSNQLNKLVEEFNGLLLDAEKSVKETEKNATTTIIIFSVLMFTFISFFLFLLSKRIKPLSFIAEKLNLQSLQLNQVAVDVVEVSNTLMSASQDESTALQQSASALEEITSMMKKTEDGVSHLDEVSEKSKENALKSKENFEEIVNEINNLKSVIENIANQVLSGNKEISEIVVMVGEIEQKTKIINDIAFQTKLLSFNASVEAARAGDHGKGFAVVAEEMGSLAQMSGSSSQEISQLLNSSLERINHIIQSTTERMNEHLKRSESNLNSCFQKITVGSESNETIVQNVLNLKELVSNINLAIKEQNIGANEIKTSILSLQNSSKNVVNSSEKNTQLSNVLKTESTEVNHISHSMKLIIEGSAYGQKAA